MRGVVMIVIDCLRADHVSSLGYARATTPTIDHLALSGTLFEQAHSTSSWTKPSVASLLTGLYPSEHGALRGVKHIHGQTAATTDVLCSPLPTLAEGFAQAGWRCGAFLNNAQLGEFTNLHRGFHCYEPSVGKADRILERFEQFVCHDPHTPFFVYLHFLEAHWPFKPRRRHVSMFGGDRDNNPFTGYSARDYGKLRLAINRGERVLSSKELRDMMQLYDGAVRRLDGKVKLAMNILMEHRFWEDTALVVTSDHGDEFMDHGGIGHGHTLYDELTRVPLLVHIPGYPEGQRRSDPVSLVDLPATLLGVAEVESDVPGCNLMDRSEPPSPVCSELLIRHKYWQTIHQDGWKLHRRYRFDPDAIHGSESGSRRDWLLTYPHKLKHELYDLRKDPAEQSNCTSQSELSERQSSLNAKMDQWWEAHGSPVGGSAGGEIALDDRVVQRLRDLGYLE